MSFFYHYQATKNILVHTAESLVRKFPKKTVKHTVYILMGTAKLSHDSILYNVQCSFLTVDFNMMETSN